MLEYRGTLGAALWPPLNETLAETIGTEDEIEAFVEGMARQGGFRAVEPDAEQHRAVDQDPISKRRFAINDEELSALPALYKTAFGYVSSVAVAGLTIPVLALVLSGLPLIAELAGIMFKYRRKRIEILPDEAMVLLALQKLPRDGATVEEVASAVGSTSEEAAEVLQGLLDRRAGLLQQNPDGTWKGLA